MYTDIQSQLVTSWTGLSMSTSVPDPESRNTLSGSLSQQFMKELSF